MSKQMREMKDSGIEWIGEIPKEWEVAKYKYFARSGMGRTILSTETKSCGIPIYSATQDKSLFGYIEETDLILNQGDLVIPARGNSIGYVKYITDQKATCTQTTIYSKIYGLDKKYVFYCCLGFDKIWYEYDDTAIPQITVMQVQNNILPLPKSDEQHRIADYLDDKCGKIDRYIEQQKQVIEKLKAYKQSVITEAVTKGLDPTVPMKDSGVEWIGEIPEHWAMIRLKFMLTRIIDCPHETPNYSCDGKYFVIRTADQDYGFLRTDDNMYRLNEVEYKNRIRRLSLDKDDIVYGREGERWGLACIVPESDKYCLGQRMMQFRCNTAFILPEFAMWALNSKYVYLQGSIDTIGSTSPHVNISTICNYSIPLPPKSEQLIILDNIKKQTVDLDVIINKRQVLIDKLTEYKKSLIYEVVTGKKEV